MKQIVSNYSYSPATNVVTLTGVNIDADQLLLIVAPQVGRTLYNFASVTGTVSAGADTRVTLNASTAGLTTTSPLVIFYDDQASTQTVAGTVTANVSGDWGVVVTSGIVGGTSNSGVIDLTGYPQNSLIEATLEISGGSAVRKFQEIDSQGQYPGADITLTKTFDGSTVVNFDPANSPSGVYVFRSPGTYVRFAYVSAGQGTNTQSYKIRAVRDPYYGLNRPISGTVTIGNSVTIGSLPAISGTVTANSIFPRVTLIDGSGTVATANTAITVFASSSTRSYLIVQVTTGSAFVNVGATATTVNGINLTAGQGYSWETTIPQGIVSLISTTTNSRYVAKEA